MAYFDLTLCIAPLVPFVSRHIPHLPALQFDHFIRHKATDRDRPGPLYALITGCRFGVRGDGPNSNTSR